MCVVRDPRIVAGAAAVCLVFETRNTTASEISYISFANTMLPKEDHPAARIVQQIAVEGSTG